jgi:hypothetical protein
MGNTKRAVKRQVELPGALTPQLASGNNQPELDPPDPEWDPEGDNKRRESSDDDECLEQALLQGENPNMAGPSMSIQSLRAMTATGTEAVMLTDVRMGSTPDLHVS